MIVRLQKLTPSPTPSFTHKLTYSVIPSLFHSVTYTLTYLYAHSLIHITTQSLAVFISEPCRKQTQSGRTIRQNLDNFKPITSWSLQYYLVGYFSLMGIILIIDCTGIITQYSTVIITYYRTDIFCNSVTSKYSTNIITYFSNSVT